MKKIFAFQIAENIDTKKFRKEYSGKENFYNSYDVFYSTDNEKSLYVLSFGVVVFCGYDDVKMSEMIDYLKPYSMNPVPEKITEEFIVHETGAEDKFGHNEISVSQFNPSVLRTIMFNVGQSVALDYFSHRTRVLLENSNQYTKQLEKSGTLNISNKSLLRFIGKTLNTRNSIIDNLYVIDSPEETWENEYLCKIDTGLQSVFDLKIRFKDIDYQLDIVKENLDLYKDLMQHRRSNLLEIIIILLILVEIINIFVDKIFK